MSPATATARQVAARLNVAALPTLGWTPGDYAAHDAAHAAWDDLPSRAGMRPRYDRRQAIRRARRNDR